MTNTTPTKPNRLLQANLACVLAFIPSYLIFAFTPKPIVQAYDLWREGLQLSLRLDVLFAVSIHWWLPALLIYLLMRMTQFDQWLKVNLLAHISLFIANFSLFAYLCLAIYQNSRIFGPISQTRDYFVMNALCYAAVMTLFSMIWHYLVQPNPKLKAWLTDDVFASLNSKAYAGEKK